jgi:hypothetical protein
VTLDQAQTALAYLNSIDCAAWTLVVVCTAGFGISIVRDALRMRDAERLVRLRGGAWADEHGVPRPTDVQRSAQHATPLHELHSER